MQGQVSQLIEQVGHREASALSSWEGHEICSLLRELTTAAERWPDTFYDEAAALVRTAAWYAEERRQPFFSLRKLDRKSSFVGGFPWTSNRFPWPEDERGRPLSPLLQLNLAQLSLEQLGSLPDSLVQVWGNGFQPVVREIPLDRIAKENPDWTLRGWQNELLYFEYGTGTPGGGPAPTDLDDYEDRVSG